MKAFVLNGDEKSQKLILQANIPFLELYKRARFTYMEDPTNDPYDETDNVPVNEFYQRRVDEERVKNIKKFIKTSILNQKNNQRVAVLFPTAMLVAVQSSVDRDLKIGSEYELEEIINEDDVFFIVDGQHRLYSMKSLFDELRDGFLFDLDEIDYILNYLKHYVFNCTVLLNYDLWEQAQVFADVNFNQKKVSASLYYTIYGMNYSSDQSDLNRNYIYIAHQLVKLLNSHPKSPLKGFIKMLGTGSGFISQAFIADSLMRNIKSPRGIWYVDPYNMKVPPVYRYMTIETLSFFSAVKKTFPDYWPKDNEPKSIICKTTGLGALLRLMAFLHQNMVPADILNRMKAMSESEICEDYEAFIADQLHILADEKEKLFSLKGNYAGSGGKGLEVKLYRELRHMILFPDLKLVGEKNVTINGRQVGVKFYKKVDGLYTYELSHYFRNNYQMEPYIPGGGSVAETFDRLEGKLQSYIAQVEPDARAVTNKDF